LLQTNAGSSSFLYFSPRFGGAPTLGELRGYVTAAGPHNTAGHALPHMEKVSSMRTSTCVASNTDTANPAGTTLASAVSIFEPDDIVFAQIRPRLDFDHLERHLAGILQTMLYAQRYVS
jgi:hypothetical protein